MSDLGLVAGIALLALILVPACAWQIAHARGGGRLRGRVASLTLASRNLLSAQGALLVLLTAVIWVGEGFLYWLVGSALHLRLDLVQGCFLVVLSSLAASIPAAPGYLGTYDAAILLGLGAMHVHGGQAVSFGLLVRLVIFVPVTLVGLVLVVVRYGGLPSLRRLRGERAGEAADRPAPAFAQVVK
jgi:hypothetical protein